MKRLGVIGGLGPLATAYFYELVTKMTEVERDQDHIEILLHSKPSIPDRTGFIIGKSPDSPLPEMIRIGQELAAAGADWIAIPCITAHYFHRELTGQIPIPILHLVEEVASYLARRGKHRVGIMATDGTVQSGLFQRELVRQGMEAVVPEPGFQPDVMHLIYEDIKLGRPAELGRFARVSGHLRERGAEVTVLGCTELSLIKRDCPIGAGFLDALDVLAVRAVEVCGGKVKEEYRELVTEA